MDIEIVHESLGAVAITSTCKEGTSNPKGESVKRKKWSTSKIVMKAITNQILVLYFEGGDMKLVDMVITESSLEDLGNGEKKRKHANDPVVFNSKKKWCCWMTKNDKEKYNKKINKPKMVSNITRSTKS